MAPKNRYTENFSKSFIYIKKRNCLKWIYTKFNLKYYYFSSLKFNNILIFISL